ncbi:MAG TPA: hypothetical protein VE862_04510 [Candidatus Acidoferrum sp.]|nr:hypothetical protein [Candidatus Acidoferrum sp.]
MSTLDSLINSVDSFRDEMIAFVVELLKIKAVNPDGGGKGEYERAPTSPDSEVVERLRISLKKLRGINARPVGIGGVTVALYFRRKGIPRQFGLHWKKWPINQTNIAKPKI